MTLIGQATIFNANRRHPPRANPIIVTVFLQRNQVRYQAHDTSPSRDPDQDPIWRDSKLQADWWESTPFPDQIEPLVILYRLRVHFNE